MSLGDFIVPFLGAFGGVGAGILAFKYLAGTLIDQQLAKALAKYKHELDKDLAELQGGMARLGDVLRRCVTIT